MSKGKGQQVMEHNLFPLEFQLPDGKDALQKEDNQQKYSEISLEKYHFPMALMTIVCL